MTNRFECPIGPCPWTWDEPEPELPSMADIAANPLGPLTARFANAEAVLRAHSETHALLQWVQEVATLRGRADRLAAESRAVQSDLNDAGLVTALLVRRLGGEVLVSDADLLSEQRSTLYRVPAALGFTLAVEP